MQRSYIPRDLEIRLIEYLKAFPAVTVLGLARAASPIWPGDPASPGTCTGSARQTSGSIGILELVFDSHPAKLVGLDEIQRTPDIFSILRSVIDKETAESRRCGNERSG
jgi:uncharacterized protein